MPPEWPPELMAEILCRLPVKVLLQIRCVSKLWQTFIDSQFFVRSHLNRSLEISKNHFILLTDSFSDAVKSVDLDLLGSRSVDLHCPRIDRSEECSSRHNFGHRHRYRRGTKVTSRHRNLPENLQVITPRWQRRGWQRRQIRVWGSCNGVVLMSGWFPTCCLWNPSTRKHLTLPELEAPSPKRPVNFYGFGYDSAIDSFKVIKIVMSKSWKDNHTHYEGWVYSLQSSSWARVTKSFPTNIIKCESQPGVLVCEVLHWPVKVKYDDDDEHDLILAFDLKTEEYQMFSQPKCGNTRFYSRLGTLNGYLCLVYSYLPVGFEVWVMRDHGVDESWTRVTLQQDDFISYPGGFSKSTLRTCKEDEDVWLYKNSPYLGGFGLNIIKTPEHFGLDGTFHTDVCVISLVSLDAADKL